MKHRKYSFLITIILCITLLTGHLSFSSYAAGSTARRARLSGINAAVYDALASKISKVASGELNSSSFSVTISLKKALGSAWKDSYTASDLGVSTLISGSSFTTETVNALDRMFNYKPDLVVEYLLCDMPYELYWFDKTAGWSGPGNISAYTGSSESVNIRENTTLVFDFYVSLNYSMTPVLKSTNVNTTKTTAAKNAMTKANQIIEKNKSKSDYEKLKAYKEEICNLASYDTAAAGNSSSYGNAHQLINVFDGNSATKVVCEGYSKAFKYLCDNTTFSNSSISCQIVTGTMSGGLGAGAHMWNVVHMNDGKNYIVDVTNCDAGTIGAPNKLFLTGATKLSGNQYQANGAAVKYTYDASTTSQFTSAELTIAGDNYPVPQSGSGNSNSGSSNSGSSNSGSDNGNSGSSNSGSSNSGSGNSNSGNSNSGNSSSGNSGSGGGNSGNSNSGSSNSGSENSNSGNNNSGTSNNSGTGGNSSGSGDSSSSAVKTVRVYFDANGGTVFFDYVDVVVGQKYGFLPYAYRSGYEFLGWSTSINSASEGAVTENTICKNTFDHILHAHWKKTSSDGSGNNSSGNSSNNSASNNSSNNNTSNNSSDSGSSNSSSSSEASSSNPVPNPDQGYSDHPEGSSEANQAARRQGGPKSSTSISAGGVEISISNGKVSIKSVSDPTVSSATYTEYADGKLKLDKPKTKAKSIYIPSKIGVNNKTYKITQIGNKAFRNNKKVTSVTLPSTLKKVEKGAFKGASKLKTITIKGGSKKTFKKIVKMIKSSSSNTRKCKFVHEK